MDKKQISRDQANDRAEGFLEKYDTELTALALYAVLKVRFGDTMTQITEAKQKQFEQVAPITTEKGIDHDNLVSIMFTNTNLAAVQAWTTNHLDLAESLNKAYYYFSDATEDNLIGRANDIKTIMTSNAAILTEITPAIISSIEVAIKNFNESLFLPKAAIKEKKAEGTDPIPGLLDYMDVIKDYLGKLIQSSLPSLYPTWLAEIKVGTPVGTRQTSAIIRYFDASTGSYIRKVKTTINNGDFTNIKYSTKLGYVRFFSLPSDNYTITSEKASFITDVKNNVGIDDKHITKFEVNLQKVIPSGTLNITVFDKATAKVLSGVQMQITKLNFTGLTNVNGNLIKTEITPDTYQAILSLTTYKTLDFTFTIQSGKTLSLQFSLEKES